MVAKHQTGGMARNRMTLEADLLNLSAGMPTRMSALLNFTTIASSRLLIAVLAALLLGAGPLQAQPQPGALGWSEGARWNALTLIPGQVADFTPRVGQRGATLRSGTPDALSSPVFRDEAGRLRALPGGVILMLKTPLSDAQAQALFKQAGVQATRRIGESTWLVESAVGMASLELANRLHASGLFDSAQPNWWMERRLR